MRHILALAAAVGMLAVAAPASAQYGDRYRGDDDNRWRFRQESSINAHQAEIRQRIRFDHRRGFLSTNEAERLRAMLRVTERLEARYRRNGLNFAEARDLHRRLDRLEARVVAEARDGNRWYG
jgi:hypothetical protein